MDTHPTPPTKKKKKTNRCALEECKCKLKLTDMKCRCNLIYCSRHRYPETHDCSWDPKSKTELEKYKQQSGLDKIILLAKMERI